MQTEALHKKKLLAPKLRFKEFTSPWTSIKFSKLTTLCTNGFVGKAKEHYVEKNGITYVQGYNVVEGGINYNGIKQVSLEFHNRNKKSWLKPGDLLTIQTGEIGLTTIVPKELEGANCHALIISRFKNDLADPQFYLFYFNSVNGKRWFKEIETGSTMKHLNVGDVIKLEVPFSTLPEQQKIASFLSTVDEKIQQLTRKKELLEQYKKGVMQQLFSGKLRFKDEGGKAFPKWEQKMFYDLLSEVLDFRGRTPLKIGMDWGGDILSLSANNVKDGYIDLNAECNMASEELYQKWMGKVNLEKGDIVFTMEAPLGKALLVPDNKKYILSQRVVAFKTIKEVNNQFLIQLIWSKQFQGMIERLSTGSTAKGINQKSFKKVKITIPCFNEQKKIANYLSNIDNKIEIVNKQITQTQTFKKGLLQQMFV